MTALTMGDIQAKAITLGFKYWRAPDAHGVKATTQQAILLLQDLIGVEVEIDGEDYRGCPECHEMSESIGSLSIEAMRDSEEIRRLRIAHLRRMLSSLPGAVERMKWYSAVTEDEYERKKWRRRDQFTRFAKAINAEITRLTQPR